MKELKLKRGSLKGGSVVSCFIAIVLIVAVMGAISVPVQAKAKKQNVVVLYFSNTGTTKSVAKKIKKITKGKLIEIQAKTPYTEEDLDWGDENSRVTKEHESADSPAESAVRPEIKNLGEIKKAIKNADVVYIGYPIWWGIAAWPTDSFIKANDFTGKTVIPFCTSSTSGLGESGELLEEEAGTGEWLDGERFSSGASEDEVREWVESLT